MTAMTKVVFTAFATIFLYVLFIEDSNAQKCKGVWNDTQKYADGDFDVLIAYNISGTKAEQSCFDVIDHFRGVYNDTPIYKYKIGGVAFEREGKVTVNQDKTITFVFKDAPDQLWNAYWESTPNGVFTIYMCLGSAESILVSYLIDKPELAAEADAVAKTLTDKDVANYKISHDGCKI